MRVVGKPFREHDIENNNNNVVVGGGGACDNSKRLDNQSKINVKCTLKMNSYEKVGDDYYVNQQQNIIHANNIDDSDENDVDHEDCDSDDLYDYLTHAFTTCRYYSPQVSAVESSILHYIDHIIIIYSSLILITSV